MAPEIAETGKKSTLKTVSSRGFPSSGGTSVCPVCLGRQEDFLEGRWDHGWPTPAPCLTPSAQDTACPLSFDVGHTLTFQVDVNWGETVFAPRHLHVPTGVGTLPYRGPRPGLRVRSHPRSAGRGCSVHACVLEMVVLGQGNTHNRIIEHTQDVHRTSRHIPLAVGSRLAATGLHSRTRLQLPRPCSREALPPGARLGAPH